MNEHMAKPRPYRRLHVLHPPHTHARHRYPHRLSRLIEQINCDRRQFIWGAVFGVSLTFVLAVILSL